jgi:hypothetical protein
VDLTSQWSWSINGFHHSMVFIDQWLSSVSGLHKIFGLRYISLSNGSWVFITQVTFIGQLVFSDFGLMAFRFHKYWPSHWGFINCQVIGNCQNIPIIALQCNGHQCSSWTIKLHQLSTIGRYQISHLSNTNTLYLFCRMYSLIILHVHDTQLTKVYWFKPTFVGNYFLLLIL